METDQFLHVVEDCASMRAYTATILEDAGFLVRRHPDASSLLANPTSLDDSCILTDIRMPQIDGLELLTRIRTVGATIPVIVMTAHGDVATAVRAMKLGASDFIEKPFAPEALLRAVRAARYSRRLEQLSLARAITTERLARLTGRERQVLERVLRGRTHREIGHELAISPRTVEVFRSRLMAKMECETVQDLVRMAIEAGEA